jgi:hypothetical protein
MAVIGQDWYDLNGSRGYPVDDGALGEDDAGRPIPPGLLVDCRLHFPDSAGRYAFIGALSSTPGLVTAIFLAADEPARPLATEAGGAPTAVPIASITLARPIDVGRHYPVQPLYPGAGGWIVLGPGIEEPYTGKFSSVRQSQLLARCTRSFRTPPIPSIGKEFVAGPLTGLVRVLGGADIEVILGTRPIRGVPRDCLIVRLADDLNRNVLQTYAGPCAGRPEGHTCARPGLELLNTVGPDCAGNLEIEFRGIVASPLAGGGGVVLDLGVGLADACVRGKYVPDDLGRLPGEFVDLCSSESLSLPSEAASESLTSSSDLSESVHSLDCVGLPFGDGFDDPDLRPGWQLEIGAWEFATDDSPEEEYGRVEVAAPAAPAAAQAPIPPRQVGWVVPTPSLQPAVPLGEDVARIDRALTLVDASRRNVFIWDDCGYDYSLGLACRTHVKLRPGAQMNGGLVINYHRVGVGLRPHYYYLAISATVNSFELWYYNGTNLSRLAGIGMPSPWLIRPGFWYEIAATTRLGPAGRAVIGGTLRAVEQADMPQASLSLAVADYMPADGKFGLATDRAAALFSFFELKVG